MKKSFQCREHVIKRVGKALSSDQLLSKQYKARERISVIFENVPEPRDLPSKFDTSAFGQKHVAINAWPEAEVYSFLGYRVLNQETLGLPNWQRRQELAIDWLAELSLNCSEPVVSHLMPESDGPIFFSHTLVFHSGRFENRYEFDNQGLLDRFPILVEQIQERMLFLSAFLNATDKFSEDA